MESTNVVALLAGVACLVVSGFVLRKAMPRDGRTSALVSTELRANAVAIGLLVLMIAGVGLIAKGVL
jgi:hypothetical protein